MPRIIAIDYGAKRVGVAVTDPLQIIATGLTTVSANEIISFLKDYIEREQIECIVVGDPKRLNMQATHNTPLVKDFVKLLNKNFSKLPVVMMDERFTSKMAVKAMIDSGMKKSDRADKKNIDAVSATIILQNYLELKKNTNQ